PPRDESSDSDSEPEAEEADDEPEAEEAGDEPEAEDAEDELEAKDTDDELEVEEAGVEPEAEVADIELEAEEPDGQRLPCWDRRLRLEKENGERNTHYDLNCVVTGSCHQNKCRKRVCAKSSETSLPRP
nr:hypothetical protein [Tanacetum cinerariifolium]